MPDADRLELLTTALFALVTVGFLFEGLSGVIARTPTEDWLAPLTIGVLLVAVYGENWYLKRVHGSSPDEPSRRTYGFLFVAFTGTILVGLWSRASGHDGYTWGTIVGLGALGIVLLAVGYYQTHSD